MSDQVTTSRFYIYRWWLFAIASLMFFLNTAATFNSLGVALPYMMQDLGWTRGEAGTGFSLLALATGLAAPVPALLLRKYGVKVTYTVGGLLLVAGLVLLATTASLTQYYCAAGLLGMGVCLTGGVPGVYLITNWLPDKQASAIGAFYMIAALGGVAGPLMVTGTVSISGSWHAHWWVMASLLLFLSVLAMVFLKDVPVHLPEGVKATLAQQQREREEGSQRVHRSELHWTFSEAIRTHQFYVVTLALMLILLCAVTMNTWAYTHMTTLGVTSTMAAAVLSAQAVANAISRGLGGTLANFIDPKWLLASALIAEVIGMTALSFAENPVALVVFALADGYGFGMCFFASTMLLVNYYGSDASPEILSLMNFITTVAMIGPVFAGAVSGSLDGFAWVFRGYAVILLIFMFVVIAMRPPQHDRQRQSDT
jgi:MFS transporter, OFA family, oxalate/formate antiporter